MAEGRMGVDTYPPPNPNTLHTIITPLRCYSIAMQKVRIHSRQAERERDAEDENLQQEGPEQGAGLMDIFEVGPWEIAPEVEAITKWLDDVDVRALAQDSRDLAEQLRGGRGPAANAGIAISRR